MGDDAEYIFRKCLLFFFKVILNIFFKDIHRRGASSIPAEGPVIFVVAPHANQFIDPLIVMETCDRDVGFLIAAKSLDRQFVGFMAKSMNSIGVIRPQDLAKAAVGKVCLDQSDPLHLIGTDTKFTTETPVGSSIAIKGCGSAEVAEVISDTSIKLKRAFADPDVDISDVDYSIKRVFKMVPKVDQSQVYKSVYDRLANNGCIGIFPEGGSHDRTDLLPLKAVCIFNVYILSCYNSIIYEKKTKKKS